MLPIAEVVSLDNPIFGTYVFWSLILIIKMMLMPLLTVQQRIKSKVNACLELE